MEAFSFVLSLVLVAKLELQRPVHIPEYLLVLFVWSNSDEPSQNIHKKGIKLPYQFAWNSKQGEWNSSAKGFLEAI